MTARQASSKGRWIPWVFVGGFLTVLAANGAMVFVAASTWTGLETTDAYREGIAYNDTLAAARAQAALGWQADLAVAATDVGADITVTLTEQAGTPLRADRVEARFERPTNTGQDFALVLTRRDAGVYRGAATLPAPGQWDVRLVVVRGADTFQTSERVFVSQ